MPKGAVNRRHTPECKRTVIGRFFGARQQPQDQGKAEGLAACNSQTASPFDSLNNSRLIFCLTFWGHISTSRGGGTYSDMLSGVSPYRSGAHLTHVFYPVSCGHRGAGYSEGGASVRSCAADDGGYVPIREEHQDVKRVNGESWLTAFAAERVPCWQLLAYLDNPCQEKPTPRP